MTIMCSTIWCTCFEESYSDIKDFLRHQRSNLTDAFMSTRSSYGISVFYNLLWFCFIIVTVRVTSKFIHLERLRLSVAMRTWGTFSSLTKVTTVHSDDVDRSTDSLETEAHCVEWPDIITYSWAPKGQNLTTNVIRMVKNKREKALICLEGIDKTRFPDFPKSHIMFWTTGFSWGMLYLQLQPKNRKFYEVFALSFCVPKLGTNRLF